MSGFKGVLKKLLRMAKSDDDIVAVLLFGSVARKEKTTEDIDVCLIFREDISQDKVFEKMVDYASLSDVIDVKVFQLLPLHVRIRVIREGKVLHVKDEDALYETVISTLREFEDFKFIYHSYLEGVLNG